MKKITKIMTTLLFASLSTLSYSHQIDIETQQKLLADGKKYSFDFREGFSIDTLKNLIQSQKNIDVEIAPQVTRHEVANFRLKDVTFLDYLYEGADSLNLEAVQHGKNKILLIPKK